MMANMERILILLSLCLEVISIETCRKENSCSCVTPSNWVTDLSDLRGVYFLAMMQDNTTFLEYRFYPCDIMADWDERNCTKESGASVCVMKSVNGRSEFKVIGQQEQAEFTVSYTSPYTTLVSYGNVLVHLICSTQGVETQGDTFSLDSHSTDTFPVFILVTRHACPTLRAKNRTSQPIIFILLCVFGVVGIVTYLVSGMLLQFCIKGARNYEIIPNLSFWKESPFLFRDGFLFIFSCYKPFRDAIGR